jgi:valyl-tRNA synthetase
MSKSKGNVITPMALFDSTRSTPCATGLRARLGVDTALDEQVMKLGRRLATKLANAGRFALLQLSAPRAVMSGIARPRGSHPLDVDFAARLRRLVERATGVPRLRLRLGAARQRGGLLGLLRQLPRDREGARVREALAERESALATLQLALRVFLRLFAPALPFVTEEVWSWRRRRRPHAVDPHPLADGGEFAGIPLERQPRLRRGLRGLDRSAARRRPRRRACAGRLRGSRCAAPRRISPRCAP